MPGIAIYARKSSESEDRQILSIDSQVRELQSLAVREHLVVHKVFTESRSGKAPGRPVFNDLYKRIQKGEFDGVICWKLDRLARNPVDGGALIWAMEEGKLKQLVTPQRTFTNTGNDKFWMQLEFGMAKKYVDDLSDNVKRGIRAKLAAGWAPGLPPLGYANDRNSRTVVPDPERFTLVRRMWELMLTGAYTPAKVADIATGEWGLRTRQFRRYGGGPLQYSTIYQMFANPFYYGVIRYGGALYQGSHEPMISRSQFDRVQAILRLASRPRPQEHSFAFTGMIRCGECGASITAEHKQNRRYGYRYIYYHCTKRKRDIHCRQKCIDAATLDQQISTFLGSLTIGRTIRDWTLRLVRELHEEECKKSTKALESLQRRYHSCRAELEALLDLRLRHLVNDADFIEKRASLESERQRLHELLNDSGTRFAQVKDQCEAAFDFACTAKQLFDTGSPEQKRLILQHCGSNLSLIDGILTIQPEEPFKLLRSALLSSGVQKSRFEPRNRALPTAVATPVRTGISSWFTLVKDVRTFYLLNPGRPTFKQTLESVELSRLTD